MKYKSCELDLNIANHIMVEPACKEPWKLSLNSEGKLFLRLKLLVAEEVHSDFSVYSQMHFLASLVVKSIT